MPGQVASVESSASTLAPTSSHRGGSGSRRMRTTAALTARMSARSNFWFAYTQKKGVATMRATATDVGIHRMPKARSSAAAAGMASNAIAYVPILGSYGPSPGSRPNRAASAFRSGGQCGVRALTVRRPVGTEVRSDQALLEQVPHVQGVPAVDAAGVVVAERQEQQRQPGRGHARGIAVIADPPNGTLRSRRDGGEPVAGNASPADVSVSGTVFAPFSDQWSPERTMRSASSAIRPDHRGPP